MKDCEVIVVGAGPAGIFAALELSRVASAEVLMIEKGHDLERRKGPDPSLASSVRGWGGAGAYSDGKLNLSSEVGGF